MTKKTERQPRRVPPFADEQEAAAFWDEHSPLDFPEEFEEIDLGPRRTGSRSGLMVRLDQPAIERLTAVADEQGIDPSTLAKKWIMEHLRALPPEQVSSPSS